LHTFSIEAVSIEIAFFTTVCNVIPRVSGRAPGETFTSQEIFDSIGDEAFGAKGSLIFAAGTRRVALETSPRYIADVLPIWAG
jgi:hypothetical protein